MQYQTFVCTTSIDQRLVENHHNTVMTSVYERIGCFLVMFLEYETHPLLSEMIGLHDGLSHRLRICQLLISFSLHFFLLSSLILFLHPDQALACGARTHFAQLNLLWVPEWMTKIRWGWLRPITFYDLMGAV